ncbi:MAG: DUF2723 domain-containing protein, partial [Planctomycetota bacterium]
MIGSQPEGRDGVRHWPTAAAVGAALLALAWLLPRSAPGLTFEDSGELAAAAYGLGVPHPPGYPLWTLLTHAAMVAGEWIGLEAARSAVWVSLLSAAGACGALAWLAAARGASLAIAVGAGLVPLAAPTFVSQALVVEVYALSSLFQALLLACALSPAARPRTAWATFGLGLAAHPSTLLLAA